MSLERPGGTTPAPAGAPGLSGGELPSLGAVPEDERTRRIVAVTGDLPRLPPVATRVTELVRRSDTSVGDLERAITPEGPLAARIVGMANSVFYAFDQTVTTLSHAIVILGFRAVASMAIATAVRSLCLSRGPRAGRGAPGLWEHSLGCAHAGRLIARLVGFEREETAFLAGLLHDVGKAVLHRALPETYARTSGAASDGRRSLADAEREELGFDHAQVGAIVAREWDLSPELVEAIADHHDPELPARAGRLAAILAVANEVAKRRGAARGATRLADGWGARALLLDAVALDPVPGIVNGALEPEKDGP